VFVALAVAAVVNRYLAKKAERDNPPIGRFIEVDGVKLHYVDRGSGDPVVLLHGNGSMIQDFESSGLIGMASRKYRVIAFDRPGFGYSARPRGTIWTPEKQADLIHHALMQIGISRATVLGHSWGASVAVALALKHPELVAGVVLASGYYYPTVRGDFFLLSGPAVPVVGDVLSHTVAPLLSRLLWPTTIGTMFAPAPVPNRTRRLTSPLQQMIIPIDPYGQCTRWPASRRNPWPASVRNSGRLQIGMHGRLRRNLQLDNGLCRRPIPNDVRSPFRRRSALGRVRADAERLRHHHGECR
jgi:pimeloyl-ACP methyl ester carboxylesterase